jgi:hypothetical protein
MSVFILPFFAYVQRIPFDSKNPLHTRTWQVCCSHLQSPDLDTETRTPAFELCGSILTMATPTLEELTKSTDLAPETVSKSLK